jgi:hypothetical protein
MEVMIKKERKMDIGIQIVGGVTQLTRDTILEVLNTRNDQKTIRAALKAISSMSSQPITASGCTVINNPLPIKKGGALS